MALSFIVMIILNLKHNKSRELNLYLGIEKFKIHITKHCGKNKTKKEQKFMVNTIFCPNLNPMWITQGGGALV